MAAQFKLSSGETAQLTGFMAVDRNELNKLTGDRLLELLKAGELELLYAHLQSLRNLDRVLPSAESIAAGDKSEYAVTDSGENTLQ